MGEFPYGNSGGFMTDRIILEAYRELATQSVILAVRDFLNGDDSIEQFERYCKTNIILKLLDINGEWLFEYIVKKKQENTRRYKKKK